MDILQRKLEKKIRQLAKSKELSPDELNALVEENYREWINHVARAVHEDLQRRSKEMLAEEGRNTRDFERRNKRRWKLPLDQLKVMIRIVEESAEGLVAEWNKKHKDDPYTFGALNHLCVRSLMLAREIICLIEGGFADGALGRWRSLHETAVAACFIAEHDELTAERFMASFICKSKKAMLQVNEYAERANLDPFSDKDIRAAEKECRELEERLGKGLGDDFGWAREALSAKGKPTLFDLEQATGLDHWRPRYRWSSQNIHSGYRPPFSSLGMAEAKAMLHLTGQSNSGMVDPIHMTAISLLVAATSFLTRWPNADRLVTARILDQISQDIGPLAMKVEANSARRAERRIAKHGH